MGSLFSMHALANRGVAGISQRMSAVERDFALTREKHMQAVSVKSRPSKQSPSMKKLSESKASCKMLYDRNKFGRFLSCRYCMGFA